MPDSEHFSAKSCDMRDTGTHVQSNFWCCLIVFLFPSVGFLAASCALKVDKPAASISSVLNGDDGEGLRYEKRVSSCMRRAGFTYVALDPIQRSIPVVSGETSLAARRAHGYNLAESVKLAKSDAPSPNEKYVEGLSGIEKDAYSKALWGVLPSNSSGPASGGCMSEAEGSKRFRSLRDAAGLKAVDVYRRMRLDPRWRKANGFWVACMNRRGYNVSSREDVENVLLVPIQLKYLSSINVSESDVAAAFHEELAVANVDADCSESIDKTLRSIQAQYESEFLDQNTGLIAKVEAARPT
jgi:hypothetical protein